MRAGNIRLIIAPIAHAFFAILCLILSTGCATEHIPTYPPLSSTNALKILSERAHAIHAITAQGTITLAKPNGDTVRLDAAIVLQPPERARLRAWKFGQAVFDLTLTPDGLWLIAPQDSERRNEITAAGKNTGNLTRQWLNLITGAFDDVDGKTVEDAKWFTITRAAPDGSKMVSQIDRRTLTPRSYAQFDDTGKARFTLRLSQYAQFGDTVWPRRIEAISDAGRILIELREVEINGELPPTAFVPPRRAEKLP